MSQSLEQLARAREFKDHANSLFVKREFESASAIYSKAIALDFEDKDFRAVLYANRSACGLSLERYVQAAEDAIAATTLKPTYAKAWARFATAKDKLKKPTESSMAWRKAIKSLPEDYLTEDETKQKQQYEDGLDAALEALESLQLEGPQGLESPNPSVSLLRRTYEVAGSIAEDVRLLVEQAENFESSSWTTAHTYGRLKQAIEMMDDLSEVLPTDRILENIAKVVMMDRRALAPLEPSSMWTTKLKRQTRAELAFYRGWSEGSPDAIISQARERATNEGLRRIALIVTGFLEGYVHKKPTVAVQHLERVIRILEQAHELWGNARELGQDSIFNRIFIFGVHKLRLDSLRDVYESESIAPRKKEALSVLYSKSADLVKVMNEFTPPDRLEDIYSIAAFYYHARGHALVTAAFCCEQEDFVVPARPAHTSRHAANYYLLAADSFPDDDEWHLVCLDAALNAMAKAGFSIKALLEVMDRFRSALPDTQVIWGAWAAETRSAEFGKMLIYEAHLQQLLEEGMITENVVMRRCDVMDSTLIREFEFIYP
ncbi:hypothetical protein PQX77_001732 [Marasmius sp. AFHP31]|nr:hypothetical protein PQX77_001732 [Marasmius sp. AFHP31]